MKSTRRFLNIDIKLSLPLRETEKVVLNWFEIWENTKVEWAFISVGKTSAHS